MSNDNGYYNDEGTRYGAGPTPPPFPGDRRQGYEPRHGYDGGVGGQHNYGDQPDYSRHHYGTPPYPQMPSRQWDRQPMPQQEAQTNPMGTAGFILSIVTAVIGWIPYMGWLIWVLAVVFSAIGMSRKPRGLAIAGLIIALGLPLLLVLAVIAFGISIAALGSTGLAEI